MGHRYFVLATAMAVGAVVADELVLNCLNACDPWNSQNGGAWIQGQINAGVINPATSDTVLLTNSSTASLYPYNYSWSHAGWVQSGSPRPGGGAGAGGGGGGGSGGGSGAAGGNPGGGGGGSGSFPPGTFCLDDGSNCDTHSV